MEASIGISQSQRQLTPYAEQRAVNGHGKIARLREDFRISVQVEDDRGSIQVCFARLVGAELWWAASSRAGPYAPPYDGVWCFRKPG